jgi:3-hydroxyacyl-CoA dehydrogenase
MKTFSEKTVELARELATDIIGEDFPFGNLELNAIIGLNTLELIIGKHFVLTGESQKRANKQKEKLKAHGIVDDATAIAFIKKRRKQLEAWKPLQVAFWKEVLPELKQLQNRFVAENN